MKYDIIIIGAGQAGLTVAASLRKNNQTASILLIGDENQLPYQRPPLSKNFISEDIPDERLLLKTAAFYEKNKISLLTNTLDKDLAEFIKTKLTIDGISLY